MAKPDLIPARGAVAEQLLLEVERELTADDLLRLADAPKVSVPILQKLRATHHRQAQLIAQGKPLNQVAAIVGCTTQRLVQLQVDPMFTELVAFYQDQIMVLALEDGARMRDKLVDVGEMAVDELRERLEDDTKRSGMQTEQVRKIAEMALDRTVAPPKTAAPPNTTPVSVTLNFGTSLRDPSLANPLASAKIIEGQAEKEAEKEDSEQE
jgi:hypothetical protein